MGIGISIDGGEGIEMIFDTGLRGVKLVNAPTRDSGKAVIVIVSNIIEVRVHVNIVIILESLVVTQLD